MCAPEMAFTMLCERGRSTHNVFACGVVKAAQQWMAHLGLEPLLAHMNMRLWNKDTGVMGAKTIDGKLLLLVAEDADLHLYVCGFMCIVGIRKDTLRPCFSKRSIEIPEAFFLNKLTAMGRADDGPNFCEWLKGLACDTPGINAGCPRQGMHMRLGRHM